MSIDKGHLPRSEGPITTRHVVTVWTLESIADAKSSEPLRDSMWGHCAGTPGRATETRGLGRSAVVARWTQRSYGGSSFPR
jgi:hypothetical protein